MTDHTVRWLTPTEVAERLGVHQNTVKRIPPEDLPYFRFGTRGDRRYDPADIDEYIRGRKVTRKVAVDQLGRPK
jgi:excisionase family DNA binding protein